MADASRACVVASYTQLGNPHNETNGLTPETYSLAHSAHRHRRPTQRQGLVRTGNAGDDSLRMLHHLIDE
eukprot:scaffold562514_cov19-Prasinocladus_malaysianus.AAC.1